MTTATELAISFEETLSGDLVLASSAGWLPVRKLPGQSHLAVLWTHGVCGSLLDARSLVEYLVAWRAHFMGAASQ
jgi:hypothetical protein